MIIPFLKQRAGSARRNHRWSKRGGVKSGKDAFDPEE
jgi:hypothetical protein